MALRDLLDKAGLSVRVVAREKVAGPVVVDAVVDIEGSRFAVEERGRAPYPNELARLDEQRARLAVIGTPLMLVPFVSDVVGESLRQAGWSWADAAGNFDLRAPGLLLRQRATNVVPPPPVAALPQGSGSLAIIRSLIGFGDDDSEEAGATSLAAQAKVSQPRASQVLDQLERLGLVARIARGRWRPDRAALLDRFVAEYRGPGGQERYLYSLDPLTEVAKSFAAVAEPGAMVVSADVGPDLVIAWRRPTTLVVYVRETFDLGATRGLVAAQGRDDANVIVRSPRDTSMFPSHRLVASVQDIEIPLADPTQMIWDLHQLGGQDRLEAAERMREWLLQPRP
jgi:hypothetical protein